MEMTDHIYGTCPATTSAAAGPLPLYGMYCTLAPMRCSQSSAARKPALPGSVAYESVPERSFTHAVNSASVFDGWFGCVTSTVGSCEISVIGAKSAIVSYGSLRASVGLVAWLMYTMRMV